MLIIYRSYNMNVDESTQELAHWCARELVTMYRASGEDEHWQHLLSLPVSSVLNEVHTWMDALLGREPFRGILNFPTELDKHLFRSSFLAKFVETFFSEVDHIRDSLGNDNSNDSDEKVREKVEETKGFRRFFLHNDEEEKKWSGVLYPNGCMALNVHPGAFPTHFCSYEEFDKAHGRNRIEWIDPA